MDDFTTTARNALEHVTWMPDWAQSLLVLGVAILLARMIHGMLFRVVTRLVANRDLFWRSLVSRTENVTRFAVMVLFTMVASAIAPLTQSQTAWLRHGLQVALIGLIGWVAINALRIWTTVHLRRFKLDSEDNLLARKHTTQLRILQRIASLLIGVIAFAAALMTFEEVRSYGVSLLASAGAAGLVVGLALQPLLKNLVAGIQLAITQPIRLDDAVIVEGEWGNVEEISATYVVVRLWDWRRLVVPLSYFIEHTFQNWTRESSSLLGNVVIYLDYGAPIDAIRHKVREIAEASPVWDKRVQHVQVTDFRENVMEVRILISASNASRTFDLRCEMREKLIDFLQRDHPDALPRHRTELDRPSRRARPAVAA
jgi:small-conductance mechanosensitive channel